jgi:RNA polymerase sigma-70 factor (ECF subfamily)
VADDFESVLRAEGPRIYALAVRLTGNRTDGDDVAQETFIRAYRSWSRFRRDAAPGTWLHRICLNVWKNRVRSEKRRYFWKHIGLGPKDDDDPTPTAEVAAPDAPLDDGLTRDERRRTLDAALAALEPDHRAIVLLRDVEDRSYEEISEILDMPLGTVKSRLARAREALKSHLGPHL